MNQRLWKPLLCLVALTIAISICFFPTFSSQALLDEQFIFNWMSSSIRNVLVHTYLPGVEQFILSWINSSILSSPADSFLSRTGPTTVDNWGPLLLVLHLMFQFICQGSVVLVRLASLFLHLINGFLVFTLFRKIMENDDSFVTPLIASLLFAVYPLCPEAVAWFGGSGSVISTTFLLCSFHFYLLSRSAINRDEAPISGTDQPTHNPYHTRHRQWLSASLTFLILAELVNFNLWFGGLILIAYECIFGFAQSNRTNRKSLLALAVLVIVTAGICFLFGRNLLPFQSMSLNDWVQVLKNLAYPINQAITEHYSKHYRYLYVLYGVLAILLSLCVAKSKTQQKNCLFALVWLLLAILPYVHVAVHDQNLYGSRWLYLAIIPFSYLLATAALGLRHFTSSMPPLTISIGVLLSIFLLTFYGRHTFKQAMAYKKAAKLLRAVQNSVQIVCAREQVPFVVIRDVPATVSIVPLVSPFKPFCMDGHNGLIRAMSISDGGLKEALRHNNRTKTTLWWHQTLQSLIPVDIHPLKNEMGPHLNAADIVRDMAPPLSCYKNARYDDTDKILTLESNTDEGPLFNMSTWLSPIESDFLYVDAQIDSPRPEKRPYVQLHWVTILKEKHEKQDRRTYTRAYVNDGQFHRYFLPLTSTGWTTNAAIRGITVGFPRSARVQVRGIGFEDGSALIPQLTAEVDFSKQLYLHQHHYVSFCYDYPTVPELGLYSLFGKASKLKLQYDLTRIKNASSTTLEISQADVPLMVPNGNELDPQAWRHITIQQIVGNYELSCSDFPNKGIYAIRIIGADQDGETTGNFSDAVYCLVDPSIRK